VNVDKELNLSSNKVCCIADLHIGVHQNSIFWHETALKWAEWLKTELQKKKIKDIFILGDLYHYRDEIAVNTIHVVNQILKLWKDFNIVILVGNHDAFYKDRSDINSLSILNGWKNITVISEPTVCTILGKQATFLPWGADIKSVAKSDILFGHLEIESFRMNSHKACDHGTKSSDLLSKADLIMTGHFHLRDERKYNDKTIIYVGNPFEMDFGDTGSTKGYYILDFNTLSYEFFENTLSPKHKKISLNDLTALKSISATEVKQTVENNIIKIVVDKKITTDNIDLLIQKISTYKPFTLSVDYSLYNDSITVNEEQSYDLSGVDMGKAIEEFVELLDIEKKADVSRHCLDLYKRACST
jgi:DNA repair exonuclease SbcCD nuclease subunit